MEFLSLNNKEISLRAEDVNAAFADYPFNVQMSEEALLNYLKRNLFDPDFSFVCVEEQKIVGFALTGRNGSSFYDIATAVLKDYRRKGIATTLMSKTFDKISKEKGQYILECLSINDKALSLYQNAGFKINRSLTVYKIQDDGIRGDHPFLEGLLKDKLALIDDLADRPSFQNSLPALKNLKDIKILYDEDNYLVYNDKSGEVIRFHGPCKLELIKALKNANLKEYTFVNLDDEVYPPKMMEKLGLLKVVSQYELIKN